MLHKEQVGIPVVVSICRYGESEDLGISRADVGVLRAHIEGMLIMKISFQGALEVDRAYVARQLAQQAPAGTD